MVSLKQQTLPAYKKNKRYIETTIIHLFEKGVTMSEIADLIEKMYGHHYTPQTMSNMTKVLTEEVNAFKSRALNDKYVAIFMDATYIPLKTSNRIQKKRFILPLYTRRRHEKKY
jgi:putative transposase